MPILKIAPDEVLKVGMFSIQCQTADGRAWQLNHRFVKDDPKIVPTIRAINAKGEIDTANWTQMSSLGSLRKADAQTDAYWKNEFARREQMQEEAAFRSDPDLQP